MNTRTQLRSTCFFCGDLVAVVDGVLADHGFKVPGFGHRTTGCPGSHVAPVETSTRPIEKAIRVNTEFVTNAPDTIARIIENGTNKLRVNTEVCRIESEVVRAKANIVMATEALKNWAPGTLIEVDLVVEATEKKSAAVNTRKASLQAKLDKMPARYARLETGLARDLKNMTSWVPADKMEQMKVHYTERYNQDLASLQREEKEMLAKLAMMA